MGGTCKRNLLKLKKKNSVSQKKKKKGKKKKKNSIDYRTGLYAFIKVLLLSCK